MLTCQKQQTLLKEEQQKTENYSLMALKFEQVKIIVAFPRMTITKGLAQKCSFFFKLGY